MEEQRVVTTARQHDDITTGEYGGIGSLIRRSGSSVMIAEPYEGFPAAKAGMRAGDVILKVDGFSTEEMALESVSDNAVVVVEWAERWDRLDSVCTMRLNFDYGEKETDRIISWDGQIPGL